MTKEKNTQSRLNNNNKRNLLADENEKAKRDLFRGSNNVPGIHSLSILKPTPLYIGFILKFFCVARWLPGATDPYLPWIYPAQEKPHCISCVISESITPDRALHNVLMDRPVPRPPQIRGPLIDDMCRRESMASQSRASLLLTKWGMDTF